MEESKGAEKMILLTLSLLCFGSLLIVYGIRVLLKRKINRDIAKLRDEVLLKTRQKPLSKLNDLEKEELLEEGISNLEWQLELCQEQNEDESYG